MASLFISINVKKKKNLVSGVQIRTPDEQAWAQKSYRTETPQTKALRNTYCDVLLSVYKSPCGLLKWPGNIFSHLLQAPDYALVSRSSGQLSLSVTLYE